jgi:hypothetical protein
MDEERDPEASYRRGYAHGAEEVFRAVSAVLPEDISSKIERWLKGDLAIWRVANLRGLDSTRECTPRFDPNAIRENAEEPFFW